MAGPTLTNPELWLKGDVGVTKSGDDVTSWADQSGNGNDFTQIAGASAPHTVKVQGKDAIYFDGSNDHLTNASKVLTQSAGEVIIAFINESNASDNNDRRLYSQSDTTANERTSLRAEYSSGATRLGVSSVQSATNQFLHGDTDDVKGQLTIASWRSNGSTFNIISHRDGSDQTLVVDFGANNGDWFGDAASTVSHIGNANEGGLTAHLPGVICEILAFDGAELSSAERTQVFDYLKSRWRASRKTNVNKGPTAPIRQSGLEFHFMADKGISDSADTFEWEDQTPNGYIFEQPLPSRRPVMDPTVDGHVNGFVVPTFDGTDDFLIHSGKVLNGDVGEVFVVVRETETATTIDKNIYAQGNVSAERFHVRQEMNNSTIRHGLGTGSTDANMNVNHVRNTITIWSVRSDGSNYQVSFFDVDQTMQFNGPDDGDWAGDELADDSYMGVANFGTLSGWLTGQICEIIAYDDIELTTAERTKVFDYLTDKWFAFDDAPGDVRTRLWLNEKTLVVNSEGYVTDWLDQSGRANHFEQTTQANRPRRKFYNGKQVPWFDGVNTYLERLSDEIASGQSGAVFIVFIDEEAPGNGQRQLYTQEQNSNNVVSFNNVRSVPVQAPAIRVIDGGTSAGVAEGTVGRDQNALKILSFESDGSNYNIYNFGGVGSPYTVELDNGDWFADMTADDAYIGAELVSGLAGVFKGKICEIIILDRAASGGIANADRTQVFEYLYEKWVGIPKPASHWHEDGLNLVGSAIDAWLDFGGGNRTVVQASGGNRPTVRNFNGRRCAEFDGTSDFLSHETNIPGGSTGALFIVARTADTAQSAQRFVSVTDKDADNRYMLFNPFQTTGNRFLSAQSNNADADEIISGSDVDSSLDRDLHIYAFFSDGSVTRLRLDRVEETTTVISGSDTGRWFADITNRDNITLGAARFLTGGAQQFFDGQIMEVILYEDVILTPAQVEQIENYLYNRWFPLPQLRHLYQWLNENDIEDDGAAIPVITDWRDQSGDAYDYTQATAAERPRVGKINGLRCGIFDGSDDHLLNSATPTRGGGLSGAIFLVVQTNEEGGDAGGRVPWSAGDTSGANDRWLAVVPGSTFDEVQINTAIAGLGDDVSGSTDVNNTQGVIHVIVLLSNGTAWRIRVNQVEDGITVGTGGNTGDFFGDIANLDNSSLGAWVTNGGSDFNHFEGAICELLVYQNVTLTDAEIIQIEDYLTKKWKYQPQLRRRGISLWLDGQRALEGDTQDIESWRDQSGGYNPMLFEQGTDAAKPHFSQVRGVQALRFNDAQKLERSSGFLSGSMGEVFIVYKPRANQTGDIPALLASSESGDAGDDSYLTYGAQYLTNENIVVDHNEDTARDTVRGDTDVIPAGFDELYVINIRSDGLVYAMEVDGESEALTVLNGTNSGDWFADVTGLDNVSIGALNLNGGAISRPFDGEICEIVVFDGFCLNFSERVLWTRYLRQKWQGFKFIQPDAPEVNESASNSVTFGQTAVGDVIRTASNSVTFTQDTDLEINKMVSNAVTFGQTVEDNFELESVSNAVTFGQTATFNVEYAEAASNAVAFGQVADNNAVFESASNAVAFAQQLDNNFKLESPSNAVLFGNPAPIVTKVVDRSGSTAITFGQAAGNNLLAVAASNSVAFTQQVGLNWELGKALALAIQFNQVARRTIEESVSSAIAFSQDASREIPAENDVTFTQLLVVSLGPAASSAVVFAQQVAVNGDLGLSASNAVVFNQVAIGVIEKNCDLYEYTPFGNLAAAPTLGTRDSIRLFDGTTTLDLRNPDFGNADEVETFQQINRSRGGTYRPFASSIWPTNTTLRMTLRELTRAEALALQAFYKTNLGKDITLTDQEDRAWTGVLLNVDVPITDSGGVNNSADCRYSVDLEFIGEPV